MVCSKGGCRSAVPATPPLRDGLATHVRPLPLITEGSVAVWNNPGGSDTGAIPGLAFKLPCWRPPVTLAQGGARPRSEARPPRATSLQGSQARHADWDAQEASRRSSTSPAPDAGEEASRWPESPPTSAWGPVQLARVNPRTERLNKWFPVTALGAAPVQLARRGTRKVPDSMSPAAWSAGITIFTATRAALTLEGQTYWERVLPCSLFPGSSPAPGPGRPAAVRLGIGSHSIW